MTTDRTIKALIFQDGDEIELSPTRSAGNSASSSSSEENEGRDTSDGESNHDEASTSGREEDEVEEVVEVVEPVKKRRRLVKKYAVDASLQASSSVVKQIGRASCRERVCQYV